MRLLTRPIVRAVLGLLPFWKKVRFGADYRHIVLVGVRHITKKHTIRGDGYTHSAPPRMQPNRGLRSSQDKENPPLLR